VNRKERGKEKREIKKERKKEKKEKEREGMARRGGEKVRVKMVKVKK
jgi:hypothetical protein